MAELEIHLRAHLGAQIVDQGQAGLGLDMPEGPAVAGVEPLRERADAMDGAYFFAERDRAVRAHQRLVPLLGVDELRARRHEAAIDQRLERHARGVTRGEERNERWRFQRRYRRDALA